MDRILEVIRETQALSPEKVRWAIEHACRVDQLSFKVWIILLAACAILASTARLLVRHLRERTFCLDEYFMLLSAICFIIETGLVYSSISPIYLIDAVTLQLPVLSYTMRPTEGSPTHDLREEFLQSNHRTVGAYFVFGWLAIFAVKASFLSLFHKMLRNVNKKLMIWFWVTVVLTVISVMAVVLETFELCSKFGAGPVQCFFEDGFTFSIHSTVVVQLLDIITDLMVISIPVLLLQLSSLRLKLKLRLVLVLCLSTACIVIGIARMAGGVHSNVLSRKQFSIVWLTFMLHCEAAVALMAGSVPALHALFTSQESKIRKRVLISKSSEGKSSLKTGTGTLDEDMVERQELQPQTCDGEKSPGLNKWQNSVANLIPKRMSSHRSRRLRGPHGRTGSTDSGILHPVLAYHRFRRQERDEEESQRSLNDLNAIKVTYNMTISSQSAVDTSVDGDHIDTIALVPKPSNHLAGIEAPEPAMTTRQMNYFVEGQFGQIQAGMQM
ncbi:unnamed protein product [Periconia digitata]|uniref:Rhodopsin domain-containing protein n=1 Tax=Periconia digitata TaxID=1303443 RepID=A0A9W4UP77_9PLEO|nr:unnamed protein product [Periconia digitata]